MIDALLIHPVLLRLYHPKIAPRMQTSVCGLKVRSAVHRIATTSRYVPATDMNKVNKTRVNLLAVAPHCKAEQRNICAVKFWLLMSLAHFHFYHVRCFSAVIDIQKLQLVRQIVEMSRYRAFATTEVN